MPKIKAGLTEGVEPTEGQVYTVIGAKEVKTAVQGYNGIRVELEPVRRKEGDENKYATMLWMRETAGVMSKLGSFMKAFLDFYKEEELAFDTDNWKGAQVLIREWQPRKRDVEVVQGPK